MVANEPPAKMQQILDMRHLVGFLGEKAQYSWWPTAFYEASSRTFLEPIFSKSSAVARYHGIVEAARRHHDEHLSVGSFHLFRLPEEIEQDLHKLALTRSDNRFPPARCSSSEAALESLGASLEGTAKAVGPVLIGKIGDIRTAPVLGDMSKIYQSAFSSGTIAIPYLVG